MVEVEESLEYCYPVSSFWTTSLRRDVDDGVKNLI